MVAPCCRITSFARCLAFAGALIVGLVVATPYASASCSDLTQNGTETGVDCGGPCLTCDGAACSAGGQCKSGSCVDSVCAVVYSVNPSQGTAAAKPGGTAIAIDPTLTIGGSGTIAGARVLIASGLSSSQDVLAMPATTGITASYASSTGILTLSGTRSVAEYQAALRTVTYRNTNGTSPSMADRVITFSLGQNGLALEATGHFYEFVTGTLTWHAAETAAANRRYFGFRGYLVTVTSAAENAFVAAKLAGQGWMGSNDAGSERTWRWVTGPEGLEAGGAGRHFFTQTSGGSGGTATNGLRVDGSGSNCTVAGDCASGVCTSGTCKNYHNWSGGEPNQWGGDEDYGHFLTNSQWNDYRQDNGSIQGYVVEFGGMPNDPPSVLSGSRTVRILPLTCFDLAKNQTETDVDCGGVCSPCGTAQVCLTGSDCASLVCTGSGTKTCQEATCSDVVRNGNESDTDCGGSCAQDCADGKRCTENADCASNKCIGNICQVVACDDSVKNGDETDVDCGGSCGPCGNGNGCDDLGDCLSGYCSLAEICSTPNCNDGEHNALETGIDCGGILCGPCGSGSSA
ncbi:MAG: C-type lectin domain-containing protein [Myxococcota bacterium]